MGYFLFLQSQLLLHRHLHHYLNLRYFQRLVVHFQLYLQHHLLMKFLKHLKLRQLPHPIVTGKQRRFR